MEGKTHNDGFQPHRVIPPRRGWLIIEGAGVSELDYFNPLSLYGTRYTSKSFCAKSGEQGDVYLLESPSSASPAVSFIEGDNN